jgi:2-polyprenyl-3-methyl-5-hydroxy-6-metoxy-1,4-benzoquinol methylase
MPDFRYRSKQSEIMDDLNCAGEVVNQTLRELDFINHWLGGNDVTLKGIDHLLKVGSPVNSSLHVVDMGCGSGDMLRLIHDQLSKTFPDLILTGIDANPNIIAFAQSQLKANTNLKFRSVNVFDASFQQEQFDIITATLFLHHFKEDELIHLLQTWKQQARLGIVINDLHRHPLAYHSIKLLTSVFSRSAMVKFDAPLSVLRGFTRDDWRTLLKNAGISKYTLNWKWAFRWQISIPAQ